MATLEEVQDIGQTLFFLIKKQLKREALEVLHALTPARSDAEIGVNVTPLSLHEIFKLSDVSTSSHGVHEEEAMEAVKASRTELDLEACRSAITNFTDKDGFSLLHWSAMAGFNEIVLILLRDFRIPVDAKGVNLQTPLMWAAMDERILTLHILIDHGADVHARDDLGDNCLTLAAQHEKLMSCLFFLNLGIDVNNTNVTGSSAAHWAAFCGAYMLLAVLMTFGCDMHGSYDRYGLLPLHRALQLEYYATAKLVVDMDPTLLDVKTKDGLNLEAFAEKSELSKRWFSDFINLCRDPNYQVAKTADRKLVEGTALADDPKTHGWPRIFSLRQAAWSRFVDLLIKMESSSTGKALIPAMALVFAIIFTSAWHIRLRAVNSLFESLMFQVYLTLSPSPAFFPHFVFWLSPYLGVGAILVFLALLVLDPGYHPRCSDRKVLFQQIQSHLADVGFVCQLNGVENEAQQSIVLSRLREWLEGKGYVFETISKKNKNLAALVDTNRICPTCWILKDLRTKHCSVCNVCCSQMDHHCLWINKCVGQKNHRFFTVFTTCAGIAQFHQITLFILLVLCPLACKIFSWSCPPALRLDMNVLEALICTAAACIHFVTYNWSAQLMTSQIKGVWEGVFINEVLSYNKYQHFLCDLEYRYSEEKVQYMREQLEEAAREEASNVAGGQPPHHQKQDGLKVVPSELSHHSEVLLQDARTSSSLGSLKNTVDETIVRHFIRNPFTLGQSGWRNCLEFWTDTVPSSIDYEKLEVYDQKFKVKLLKELRDTELKILRKEKQDRGGPKDKNA